MDYQIFSYEGDFLVGVGDVEEVTYIVGTNIVHLLGKDDQILGVFDTTKALLAPY